MRIGLDFDNTIACYEGVFHAAAVERGLIPPTVGRDKTSVRDHLRSIGREDDWTELQGYVYGARMDLVSPYPGALAFIRQALDAGHAVFIVSHKTLHPFRGPPYDLHAAARRFLADQRITGDGGLRPGDVRFETTLEAKLARIADLACDVFVDDLPEILSEAAFPAKTRGILFDPHGTCPGGMWHDRRFEAVSSWNAIGDVLLGQGAPNVHG